MYAANGGHLEAMQLLVSHGARLSSKDDAGETCLMKAAKKGHLEVVEYIIQEQSGGGSSHKNKSGKVKTTLVFECSFRLVQLSSSACLMPKMTRALQP